MEQKQTEMCKKLRETGLVGNFIPKAVLFWRKIELYASFSDDLDSTLTL